MIIQILAVGWAALLAAPLVHGARRVSARDRAATLASTTHPVAQSPATTWSGRLLARLPEVVAGIVGTIASQRDERRLADVVARELPPTVDLLAVAVGAGCTPFLAVDAAARWAPPTLAATFDGVRRACALGRGFDAALDDTAAAVPALRPLADALLASERFGAPVGDALLRLAAEQRAVVRRRAEARARTVPVRLLFPLVFLVLPAFGLLTVVPAVLGGLGRT